MKHYLTVMFLLCLNIFFRWDLEMTRHSWDYTVIACHSERNKVE
jgi:hypothetical protein